MSEVRVAFNTDDVCLFRESEDRSLLSEDAWVGEASVRVLFVYSLICGLVNVKR